MASNLFNSVKMTRPKTNRFDLSHDVKMSLNMGKLTPTMIMECIPGDKFNISCESLLRFAPLTAPVMHRMDVFMHYFFVPNRILWPNWEKYITNTPVGANLPAFPTVDIFEENYSKLHDYMGIPKPGGGGEGTTVSALPFAAYQMIFNEYYRDQNLQAPVDFELVDGANDLNIHLPVLRYRCWEHDYLTAALPFAQKGDPVEIPLGNFNDVPVFRDNADGGANTLTGTPDDQLVTNIPSDDVSTPNALYAATSGLITEATNINDLRRAFKLQEWLEKAARGGSRYIENILVHFGIRSSDKRLQRPEYITGTKSPVIISEVLNTSDTATAPQGNMAGHGVAVTSGQNGFYKCEEHGYIIGIMSVMPKTAYQQGIPKHFTKYTDPFEFYWPSFANIGEQPVNQEEVWAYSATPKATFGYVPRYAEYKFMQNRVAGDFRDALDFWHLGRIFPGEPSLNESFVICDPDTRIFAVTDPNVDHLYAHVLHKISAIRSMPKFGTPTF